MTKYNDSQRGTGRTTAQMRAAPQGALFIWCNEHTDYPKRLARQLGRTDLVIEPASVLDSGNYRRLLGRKFSDIVLDHAALWYEVGGCSWEVIAKRHAVLREIRPSVTHH